MAIRARAPGAGRSSRSAPALLAASRSTRRWSLFSPTRTSTISPWSVALFAAPAVRGAASASALPAAARDTRGAWHRQRASCTREPFFRHRSGRDARRSRPVHSWPLGSRCDLCARHRQADGAVSGANRSSLICAGSFTMSGRSALPAGLLEKPGALSLEERRQMEQHSVIGERILRNVDDYAEIAAIVRHHHERVDGNGYPDRLEGDEIPLLARIIAVADAYNAMTRIGRIATRCRAASLVCAWRRPSKVSSTLGRRCVRGDPRNGLRGLSHRWRACICAGCRPRSGGR